MNRTRYPASVMCQFFSVSRSDYYDYVKRLDKPAHDADLAENFFSILKTECIYRHQAATFEDAKTLIDNYIYFYNHQRIQLKTGVAPLTLRHSA